MIPEKILQDELIYANEMKTYLYNLKAQARLSPEQAKKDAIDALKRTGVIEKDGSAKIKIVSL